MKVQEGQTIRHSRAPAARLAAAARPRQRPGLAGAVYGLQRTIGNQAVVRLLGEPGSRYPIQRSYTTFPVAFAGNDPETAQGRLMKYVGKEPVATGGLAFQAEYERVRGALAKIQPSKAKELEERRATIGMKKDSAEGLANAQKLEVFVNYVNGLVATYQLDAAPLQITARVDDDGSHHMDYYFKLPGEQAEGKFDLDEWSRKGKDFLSGASSGAVIQGIVNEAVQSWDTKGASIVSVLVDRLLGGTSQLGGSATTQNVPALFMTSAVGQNYSRILMAAQHIIGVRTSDLKPRGVKVQNWKKHATNDINNAQDGTINWPVLLSTARAKFKEKMLTTDRANQDQARIIAVDAIAGDEVVSRLSTLGVLKMNRSDGTFALNNKSVRDGNDVYQAMPDERFNFDINHFVAILFFEWKAVSDLKT